MTPRSALGRLHDLAAQHRLAQLEEPNLDAARELCEDAELHARSTELLLRAGGEGEHRITFEAADCLLTGVARRTLSDAGYLRQLRNANMYRNERTGLDAAQEAAGVAEELAAHVLPVLRAKLP